MELVKLLTFQFLFQAAVRKIDESTLRMFKDEWKEAYLFSIGEEGKPICLVCGFCVSVTKKSNISRHYSTKHCSLDVTYPVESELRRDYIARKDRGLHG